MVAGSISLGSVFRLSSASRKRGDGQPLRRPATLGTRVRVAFETDAEDSYFVRDIDAGVWNVQRRIGDRLVDATGWITTGPKSGVAQLWFDELPADAQPGSQLEYVIEVTDPGRVDAFRMELTLDVSAANDRETTSGTSASRNANSCKGRHGGSDSLLNLPRITPVHRDDWPEHDFNET